MTTNIDRAAAVMARLEADSGLMQDRPWCEDYARRLADAGLLAPDLPEPLAFPSGEMEWGVSHRFVNLHPDGTITAVHDGRSEDEALSGVRLEAGVLVFTDPSEASELAYDLLAAVENAEGLGQPHKTQGEA